MKLGPSVKVLATEAARPDGLGSTSTAQRVIAAAVKDRKSKHSGKSLVYGLLFLLVMIGFGLLLALAVGAGNPNDNSPPTCGGEVMQPGDLCGRYKNGVQVGTSTYQEELDQQHNGSPTARIIGWGLVGLGVLLIVPVCLGTNPRKPWGKAVAGSCPNCGRNSLREGTAAVSDSRGRKTVTPSGIVTLCTPECGFAHIRQR